MKDNSLAGQLRALPEARLDAIVATCTAEELAALRWAHREFWLRPDERAPGAITGTGQQPPPGDWIWWVNQGGRGSGKSTSCMVAFADDAHALSVDFVGVVLCENDEEARKLIEDKKSGMRALLPPWKRPTFNPSVEGGLLTFPSGAIAHVVSAEKPSKGRGSNFNRWLIDDPPKFGPAAMGVFIALRKAFRLQGHGLRCYIATTPPGDPPPRCPELLEHLLAAQFKPEKAGDWVYSITASDDNYGNLDADVLRVAKESEGGVAEDAERHGIYDPTAAATRVFREVRFDAPPVRVEVVPDRFDLIVISIDPAESSNTTACEVGIVAGGITMAGHGYLLEDASNHYTSDQWPDVAWELAERLAPMANRWRFVVEDNRGTKDTTLIRMAEKLRRLHRGLPGVSVCEVRSVTSKQGKAERAKPLPRIYTAGQMHHRRGLERVEAQMRILDTAGRGKLDRADAAVYCELDLFGLLDLTQPGTIGGASMSFAAVGPRPQQAVAVGPMPSQGPRTTSAASFQSAAMPGQVRR